jgi:hypothetical protein
MSFELNRDTFDALKRFPAQLEAFYRAIPAEYERWSPVSWDGIPSEPFNPIEQICHVRDIEIDGYQVRFRRALAQHNPRLETIDGFALARERAYLDADADKVFAAFRAARLETVDLLDGVRDARWDRPAIFEDCGVTVRSLVHFLCSHDQQHLAGLQWLLGKIAALRGDQPSAN